MDPAELAAIDIGTLGGLRTYLGSLTEDPQARA
jgi:hypothetical protein